jgi:hypothetical protein
MNGLICCFRDSQLRVIPNRSKSWLYDCCTAKDEIFICGKSGTLLKVTNDHLFSAYENRISDSFTSVCFFKDQLFVSGVSALYRLEGKKLARVEIGIGEGLTHYALCKSQNIPWSIGAKHIVFTYDGKIWEQLFWDQ